MSSILKVVKTHRLLVKYASLPITSTALEIVTQMVEPVTMFPKTYRITHIMSLVRHSPVEEVLANMILDDWKIMLLEHQQNQVMNETRWMSDICEVEFVPCQYLAEDTSATRMTIKAQAEDMLLVSVPTYNDHVNAPNIGWISSSTWRDIQDVRSGAANGRLPTIYQFNLRLRGGGDDEYIRCCASADPKLDSGVSIIERPA